MIRISTKRTFLKNFGILTIIGLFGLTLGFPLVPITNVNADVLLVSVAITASPSTICSGQSSHLTWSSTDATSISINQGIGSVLPYGDRYVSPTQTTTYTITGTNSTGGYGTASATVFVSGPCYTPTPTPTPQPIILNLTANPTSICRGDSSTLSWDTSNAVRVTLSGMGDVPLDGSRLVSPTYIQTYRLTAYNSEGASVFRDVNVDVRDCTSCNTSANISVSPSSVRQGESAAVYWNTSNASYAVINQFGSVSLSGSRTVSPSQTTTYTINANDNSNCSDSASATLIVTTSHNDIYPTLSVDKLVRNITSGGGESNSVNANSGDTVEFVIRIYVSPYVGGGNNYANNIRVYDSLPSGLSYISGSTTVDGNYTSDGIISGGLYIGSRNQGSTATIKFRATVDSGYYYNSGYNYYSATITNVVNVSADNVPSVNDSAIVYVGGNYQSTNMTIDKFVRNISRGQNDNRTSTNASYNETIEFDLKVKNTSSTTLYNVIVSDNLPAGLTYSNRTTGLNNSIISDGIVGNGVNIGTLSSGQEVWVKFYAVVNTSNQMTITNVASVRADNFSSINSSPVTIYLNPGVVYGAIDIKTGASGALYISLFGAMLSTLGYYIYKRKTLSV